MTDWKGKWEVRSVGWFAAAVLAAVATPTTDAVTMLGVMLAAGLAFEAGYLAYRWWQG